jgi:hypothetical protein
MTLAILLIFFIVKVHHLNFVGVLGQIMEDGFVVNGMALFGR